MEHDGFLLRFVVSSDGYLLGEKPSRPHVSELVTYDNDDALWHGSTL